MRTWSLCPLGFEAELDVLDIRLRTLADTVDVHVIAEATRTYAGAEKQLHYPFAAGLPSVNTRYVVVNDGPAGTDGPMPDRMFEAAPNAAWARENHQRDALMRGCEDLADDDLVCLSDLDEIPAPSFFPIAAQLLDAGHEIVRPAIPLHVMALNWRWPQPVPVICRFMRGATLRRLGPQRARLETGHIVWPQDGQTFGWHISYLGGPDAIAHKVKQAAHRELDRPEFTDVGRIAEKIRTGADVFDRPDRPSEWVGLGRLPLAVRVNPERYRHLMVPRP
jgi:beta-1,4-mannosyl-glycoprotein beta-1,4-N-acetylglucosaminyltransferase